MKSKTIVRLFAMATIAAFFSFTAVAQEQTDPNPLAISVTQPDSGALKFMVIVGNPDKQKVQLKVTNANYGTIDRQIFKSSQYGMVCNLTDAADGLYTIEVRSRKKVIKRTIAINTVSVYNTNRMASLVSNTK
ncbi:MAG: hypothetical protein ABI687_01675 [Flavitalea sp.]